MTAKIIDHVGDSLARLTEKHKGKDNIELVLTAFGKQTQELEDALYQLLTERQIDSAVGTQLDVLGKHVGEPRAGLSDSDYRRTLRSRIAANNSEGRISDIVKVTRGVLNDIAASVAITPYYPAALVVRVDSAIVPSTTADILISFLRDTVSGGVNIQLTYTPVDSEENFQFGAVTELSAFTSFGSLTVPVDSTEGFPESGSIIIDHLSGAFEETWAYTSKDATTFYGTVGTATTHASGVVVKTADSSTQGFSHTGTPTLGGTMIDVIE